jgi:hypothetical protein
MNRITHLIVMNGLPTFDRFTCSVMAAVLSSALAAAGAVAAARQAEPAFLVRDRSAARTGARLGSRRQTHFFWINGDGGLPIPKDAYYMAGAGDQSATERHG